MIPLRFLFASLSLLISSIALSQEWKYVSKNEHPTSASHAWVDAAGNSYHNISETRSDSTSSWDYEKSLLILDKHGNFNGRVQINSCKSRAILHPFNEGNYLSNDYNCNSDGGQVRDSRVFDHKGNLLVTGEGFPLYNIASVKTAQGYTHFTIKSLTVNKPTLGIRTIDWDFNIEDQTIDLSTLNVPGKQFASKSNVPPVQLTNGRWAIPFSYGRMEKGNKSMLSEYDVLFITDGQSILGRFQGQHPNDKILALQTIDGDIAVVIGPDHREEKKVYILNESLNIKHQFVINQEGDTDAILFTKDNILMLNLEYDWVNGVEHRYLLYVFDREGNLVRQRLLMNKRIRTFDLLPFGANSALLVGSVIESDLRSYALIWKLDIDPTDQPTTETQEKAEPSKAATESTSPISDMTVEGLSEEAISVAVFPNPASIYINFALKNTGAESQRFQLKVFSMDGKQVHQANFESAFYELDIATLPSGTYSYLVINQDNKKEFLTGKFVKSR